ncbi:MAG: hypothetical protein WCX12_03725 [Candidatus Paceibacterota bacterium]|jgi:hypothetical protein
MTSRTEALPTSLSLAPFQQITESWLSIQTRLSSVIRWDKYIEGDGGVRIQNSCQHSLSISLLGIQMMTQISPYAIFDRNLVLSALIIHDFGEGEMGRDTVFIDKSGVGDLEEYSAFLKVFSKLPPDQFYFFHRAFLLQFALDVPKIFPHDAKEIMKELARNERVEALVFRAVEIWDYLLYAFEQYTERGNVRILVQTLRHQIRRLDYLARSLPGFRKEIWKKEIRDWCVRFVDSYEGQFIEAKGE